MIAKANLNVGGVGFEFEFEGQNEMDAMNKAITVAMIPTYCTVCKKEDDRDNFYLTTNRDKEGNIYVNLKHKTCGGRVKLGQYKQGGYFWHRDFEVFQGSNQKEQA